jgi:hypothetical protein
LAEICSTLSLQEWLFDPQRLKDLLVEFCFMCICAAILIILLSALAAVAHPVLTSLMKDMLCYF